MMIWRVNTLQRQNHCQVVALWLKARLWFCASMFYTAVTYQIEYSYSPNHPTIYFIKPHKNIYYTMIPINYTYTLIDTQRDTHNYIHIVSSPVSRSSQLTITGQPNLLESHLGSLIVLSFTKWCSSTQGTLNFWICVTELLFSWRCKSPQRSSDSPCLFRLCNIKTAPNSWKTGPYMFFLSKRRIFM